MSTPILAIATTGPGCGMVSDQRKRLRTANPRIQTDNVNILDHSAMLAAVRDPRLTGGEVWVSSIANLGPTPAAALEALDAAQQAGVVFCIASPAPVRLGPGEPATALLRASLAHSAAALAREVAAATPDLPEQVGRGRPRLLDDDAVRDIARAGAGTSAADLAAALGVSARTVRRYRARLRDA